MLGPHRGARPRPHRDAGHALRAHRGRAAHASSASRAWWSRTPWRCRACARPGRARRRCAPCGGRGLHPAAARSGRRHPGHRARGAAGAHRRVAHRRVRACASWRPRSASGLDRKRLVDPAAHGGGGPAGGRGARAGRGAPVDHGPAERGRRAARCTPRSRCASSISCCPATRATTRSSGIPEAELAARRIPTQTVVLGPGGLGGHARAHRGRRAGLHARAGLGFRAGGRLQGERGHGGEPRAPAARACRRPGRPVILVSFGSPYLLRQVPAVSAYVCAYGGGRVEPARGRGRGLRRVSCEREGCRSRFPDSMLTATASRSRGTR